MNHTAAHALGQASRDSFALLFSVGKRAAERDGDIHILDVGSYFGSFAEKAIRSFPDRNLTVHCFDAFPGNIATARDRLNDNRIKFVNAAVTSTDRESVTFAIPKASFVDGGKNSWGGRVAANPSAEWFASDEKIIARGVALDTYLLASGVSTPFIVKIDIQGGEFDALIGMQKSLPEVHLLYVECQLLLGRDLRYISFLEEMGFAVVFDSFQFGMRSDLSKDECYAICKRAGLDVYRFIAPGEIYATANSGTRMSAALLTASELTHFFTYFQTDLLAVNTRKPGALMAFFETLMSR